MDNSYGPKECTMSWSEPDQQHLTVQGNKPKQRAAKGVLKGIGNRLWYLTEELLPLSLFSNGVSEDTKVKIAKTILSSGPEAKSMRTGASHRKPVFPTMPERINEDLVQFVAQAASSFLILWG